jgi:menaquinone-9 beta-reductase
MTQRYDVGVIGSGPAGAACALRLARMGASVALVDEREFPREKLCGEYLNLGTIRELRELGLAEELEGAATELHGMRLFVHDEIASFPISPPAWSIARTVLDERLRAAALVAGAQPLHGRLTGIRVGDAGVALHLRDREGASRVIGVRYVVGADGMRSTVARLCRLTKPPANELFAIGGHHPTMSLGKWIEIYISPRGYLALNPLDERAANAVFVMSREHLTRASRALRDELARFSDTLTRGTHVIDNVEFDARRHAIGPLTHRTIRPTHERVLLVGDAAAFIDPFTGQGIYLALTGARLAARAIAGTLEDPDREREAWLEYARALGSAVGERELVASMMRAFLRWRLVTRRAARALRRRPGEFTFLIDAVCAKQKATPLGLAAAVGQVLR